MDKLKVIPLGTVSPYSKDDKNCPGFLIKYKDKNIMFDCGNGVTRLMNMPDDLKNLKVFISHMHPDHYGDLSSLFQAALVYKRLGLLDNDIEVYIPGGDSIDYSYIQSFKSKYPVVIHNFSHLKIANEDITITSLNVEHDIEAYAFRIDTSVGSVTYSGDTGTRNKLREFAKDSNLFICESTFLEGQSRDRDVHLYAKDAASIAKDANVKKLILTHFWPEIDKNLYLEEAKELFSNTEVAVEGKTLVLKK